MKQLPNILTVLRFVLTGFFIWFFLQGEFSGILWATVCFGLAAVTDWLDGYFARKYDVISSFGKMMDPIADKFLMLSAFALFAGQRLLPCWAFWVIAFREIGLTVFRFWAMARGQILAAERMGKLKTVFQMIIALLLLAWMILVSGRFLLAEDLKCVFGYGLPVLEYMMVAVTVISGVLVLWNNRTMLKFK